MHPLLTGAGEVASVVVGATVVAGLLVVPAMPVLSVVVGAIVVAVVLVVLAVLMVLEGAGAGEGEVWDAHTASTTNSLPLHFVPVGTGFTYAAPLAHWYHQSPHSSRQLTASAATPAHCTSELPELEPEAALQNS